MKGSRDVQHFDLNKACFIAESFASSADLICSVIDAEGHVLVSYGLVSDIYQTLHIGRDKLSNSFIYGANQAAIYGGRSIFFGPYGLVYFTVPILMDDSVAGALTVGPIMMTKPDRYLYEALLEHSKMSVEDPINVVEALEVIPIVDTKKVKALSDLLFCSASYLSPDAFESYDTSKQTQGLGQEVTIYLSHLKTMGGDMATESAYPYEKEKELMNKIAVGDEKGATQTLNEILAVIYLKYGKDFDSLKSRILELVVLLSRAAMEGGAQAEEIFGMNFVFLQKIHEFNTTDQLVEWLAKITKRFSNVVFKFEEAKHKDVIFQTIEYIRQNYMSKITLEEAASNVYLSSPYLSKVFKEETGITFNKYLTRVRIYKSEELLREKDMNLADIADAVGFHDQSHFSKQFKSVTGTSPKKFRANNR